MASKWPPVKGVAYKFRASLFAQADNQILTTPTIAAGDFKVSIDGGAFANLATLPSEEQSGMLEIDLSASEMNGDEIFVKAVDASGDEWHSQAWCIHTVAQTLDTVDSNVDSILADTGTDGVVLANDAITSAKFDESTAFPLKSADTGATQIARVGADGDTLETLSDQLDAVTTDTNELQTDWTNGGRLDLIVDAILTDTAEIGAAGAGLSGIPWNAAWDAEFDTTAQVVDAVWDEALSGHVTAGTSGKAVADIEADTNELQTDNVPGLIAALNDPTAQAIAQAVLSENVANVEDTASLASLAELILAVLESRLSGASWEIFKTDHATLFNTRTISTNSGQAPVVEVD